MHARIPLLLVMCVVTTVLQHRSIAADAPPATQPVRGSDVVISEMRVQTIAGFTYLYDSAQTSFEKIAAPIGKTLPALMKSAAEGKFRVTGPVVFVYRDLKDLSQPFTLDIGITVAPETAAFGEYKVRKVEPFKCATVIYSGPLSGISEAYGKLMASIGEAKLKPTTTSREFYLYWEGPESPNNVVQIQIGIE
jgi:effector-binding domain-containing protein